MTAKTDSLYAHIDCIYARFLSTVSKVSFAFLNKRALVFTSQPVLPNLALFVMRLARDKL